MCCCEQSLNILFLFLISAVMLTTSVRINKLQVPEVIKHGNQVVLDCDFTLEETDQDLVVKWYFSKSNRTLVYQWIPASQSRPQVLGVLKDRLNLENSASVDANSRLHILKAGPDLSGDYTCSVSTMQSEDIRTKSMLVFVPERRLSLRRLSTSQRMLRVQCLAEEVFPDPIVTLYSLKRDIGPSVITSRQRGQLYDISATVIVEQLQEPEEFACELTIAQANYSVRRETVIYPGNMGRQLQSGGWKIVVAVCFILLLRDPS